MPENADTIIHHKVVILVELHYFSCYIHLGNSVCLVIIHLDDSQAHAEVSYIGGFSGALS